MRARAKVLDRGLQRRRAGHRHIRIGRHQGSDGHIFRVGLSQIDDQQFGGLRQPLGALQKIRQVGAPPRAAQIGEEVHFLPLQAGIIALGRLQNLFDLGQRSRQVAAAVRLLEVFDLALETGSVERRRADDHARRRAHQHQREAVSLIALLDDLGGELLGAIE